jgi:hypothetical protein
MKRKKRDKTQIENNAFGETINLLVVKFTGGDFKLILNKNSFIKRV